MTTKKFDGVIEAVHYAPNGRIEFVRAYVRRGPTFSDHILIDRQTLIENIKSGKRFFTGKRTAYLASTFELHFQVEYISKGGSDTVTTNSRVNDRDMLEGVPLF